MLVGNLVSILSGGTITVVVSLIRGKDQPPDTVWENTRDIDNPLRPWSDFYVRCIRFHLDLGRVQLASDFGKRLRAAISCHLTQTSKESA